MGGVYKLRVLYKLHTNLSLLLSTYLEELIEGPGLL